MSNNSTLLLFVPETINTYFLGMKIILCHVLDSFKFVKFLYVKHWDYFIFCLFFSDNFELEDPLNLFL